MPETPDREVLVKEALTLESTSAPSDEGEMRFTGGAFQFKDGTGTFDPRTGGGGGLPPSTQIGQVLYSVNGSTFTVQLPLTTCEGWLVNNTGELLVVG